MLDTQFLATALGLFALLQGTSRLITPERVISLYREVPRNQALAYVLGSILTIFGAILVVGHSIWRDWQTTLVSLTSWGILIDGCIYLFLSREQLKYYLASLERPIPRYSISVGFLVLGTWLLVNVAAR